MLPVEEHCIANIVDSTSSWVIDSCTPLHVTSRKDIFDSYTSSEFGDVKLTHEGARKCVGLGEVDLDMK